MKRVWSAARATFAAATVIVAFSGWPALPAAAAETQVTATTNVNIRSAPSTNARIVGGLFRGQTVTATGTASGWTTIRMGSSAAYVASRYLSTDPKLPVDAQVNAGAVRVTTTEVNLRRGPGLGYPAITVLRGGTSVTLTGKTSRGFAEVYAGPRRGWVSLQYLASSADGLPAVIGTRVATADLLIRTTPNPDFKVVGEIKKGSKVAITGATRNGRAQIIYRQAVRWVTARYLANPPVNQPVVPGLPKITGYRYATTALLIRSSSSATFRVITEVPTGTRLAITGVLRNGRAQIVFDNAVRWVTATYLSTKAPAAAPAPTYAVERGLKPNAIKVHRAARAAYPRIKTYYGVRPDSIPDHPSGRALDLMLPNYTTGSGQALGRAVADWARKNQAALGIEYVIFNQRIWNVKRDKEGWRYMADRGDDSANHKNHVHITVFG